ncbi:MAG: hypothetical protein ACE5NA_09820 [Nitrospiraceae bacterium]
MSASRLKNQQRNAWDALLDQGLDRLRQHLITHPSPADEQFTQVEVAETLDTIRNFHYLGITAFLASGFNRESLGPRELPLQDLSSRGLRAALDRVAQDRGVPLTIDESERVLSLLSTGKLHTDLTSATAEALYLAPRLPIAMVRDVKVAATLPPSLEPAVEEDLAEFVHAIPEVKRGLKEGRLDGAPTVLPNTLRQLYLLGSIRAVIETVQALLEIETVRLAIVVYARSQGIPLKETDLDALREALDPKNPDLGQLLIASFRRLAEHYGREGAKRILQRSRFPIA